MIYVCIRINVGETLKWLHVTHKISQIIVSLFLDIRAQYPSNVFRSRNIQLRSYPFDLRKKIRFEINLCSLHAVALIIDIYTTIIHQFG